MKIILKKGKNLSTSFIERWNEIMLDAFSEDTPLNPRRRKPFINDVFFILQDNEKQILSVGRLKPVRIKFHKKIYDIEGIADVVSIIKGKGYGKKLMKFMLKYLKSRKMTGIGFCARKNSPFYEKIGFNIEKDLVRRFVHTYKNSKGKVIKEEGGGDVLYVLGKNDFLKAILLHPKDKIFIPISHW